MNDAISTRGVKLERLTTDFVASQTIKPLRDVLYVKPLKIHFSDTLEVDWRGKAVRGRVVAVGRGRYPNIHRRGTRPDKDGKPKDWRTVHESKHFRPTEVKVGDVVELGGLENQGYAFATVMIDGVECVECTEQDVCAVHEPDCDCPDCH